MRIEKKSSFNIYYLALILLCLANILELFVPRMDEGNYFVRIPIQLINGGLLVLMWGSLLLNKIHWTPVTKSIFLFIPLLLIYSVAYFFIYKFNISDFAAYIRFLLWTTAALFFYEMLVRYGPSKKILSLYIITFIVAITKKILESSLMDSEKLGGGDTASLPLLFIIPVILICFEKNAKLIILAIVAALILFSLRRTVILGLVLCLPFIYQYVKAQLKTLHLIIFGLLFISSLAYTWEFVGEAVIYRFQDLLEGDRGGTKESFGSGRSEFYKTVWDGWRNGDLFSLLFGNGLTSAEKLLMRVDNIRHAHNDFLQIIYTFGILGIGIWITFLLRLWRFRKQLKFFSPQDTNLFYICFISYLVIAMASGCVLRITTLPFALTVSILLYQVKKSKRLLSIKRMESETEDEGVLTAPLA
jgi:hypothetical protein